MTAVKFAILDMLVLLFIVIIPCLWHQIPTFPSIYICFCLVRYSIRLMCSLVNSPLFMLLNVAYAGCMAIIEILSEPMQIITLEDWSAARYCEDCAAHVGGFGIICEEDHSTSKFRWLSGSS